MSAFILSHLFRSKRKLVFLLLGLLVCGLGSAWWVSAQSEGGDQTFDFSSKETALWAFLHPIKYYQLLESMKSPEQREKDSQDWFFLYNPDEYARLRAQALSKEQRQVQARALSRVCPFF